MLFLTFHFVVLTYSMLDFVMVYPTSHTFWATIAIFLAYHCLIINTAKISCLNQANKPVDWYLIYKLPDINKNPDPLIQKGLGFLYTDPDTKGWQLSTKSINDSNQAVAYTLKQVYDTISSNSVYRLLYNDEFPDNGKKSSYRGHTKGVQLFDKNTGFWLIHSVPRFPSANRYYYPNSGTRYGQSMLCTTFDTDQVLGEISKQMYLYQPFIYDSKLPGKMAKKYPVLEKVLAGKSTRKGPFSRQSVLLSRGGKVFRNFAKHRKWGKDLYADFVAPSLKESIYVETWLNGPGDLPSVCNQTYQVHNLRGVQPDSIGFTNSKDHSKWAVSLNSTDPWICIGDINRQKSQDDRGGGTLCLENKEKWNLYTTAAETVEDCPIY